MTRKLLQPIETAAAVLSQDFSLDANNPYLCKPKNELSFAIAKQPYLEADRPIGKSLSRCRERKGNSPVDYFSEQPGGTARDLGIG